MWGVVWCIVVRRRVIRRSGWVIFRLTPKSDSWNLRDLRRLLHQHRMPDSPAVTTEKHGGPTLNQTRGKTSQLRYSRNLSGTPAHISDGHKRKASQESTAKKSKKSKSTEVAGLAKNLNPKRGAPSASGVADVHDVPTSQYGRTPICVAGGEEGQERFAGGGRSGHWRIYPAAHPPNSRATSFPSFGSMTLPPWESLTQDVFQVILNRVYDQVPVDGELAATDHIITEDGPWWGLTGYRTTDWRSSFAEQAHKELIGLFDTQQKPNPDSDAEEEPEQEDTEGCSGNRPSLPAASDTDTAAKPKPFDFKTPAGIKEFIVWTLQTHTNGSKAFYWRQWGDGIEKKVDPRAIHPLRIAASWRTSPLGTGGEYTVFFPCGAKFIQVECELSFWKTGVNVVPRGPSSHFSFDKWGDIKHRDLAANKLKITRRATKFLLTLKLGRRSCGQNWRGRRRSGLRSRSVAHPRVVRGSSKAGDGTETWEEDEEDVILVSD
ncbi:hypothetical protein B0H16DRAFT_1460669 [Mycena metata]|uniref:Uncharacterized protein n=1 Tax=Mycena metata TaxID=1033252 RepID=A0AAD7N7W3_9AGAR|nr:hypothetical protein B0H16DRAFT_1460669 [Mycena metata]